MTRRISVRLPDYLVAWMDQEVASGAARSRSEVITRAMERERQRELAERELETAFREGRIPASAPVRTALDDSA